MSDLIFPGSKHNTIWPASAFAQFVGNVNGPKARVVGATAHQLRLPPQARDMSVWHVASLRIDPSAPGVSQHIGEQFGATPQIRLVLQPVTKGANGVPEVHDVTAHLIFSFVKGVEPPAAEGCSPRPIPDMDAFKAVVADFAALRTKLKNGEFNGAKIHTEGLPLGVHPGLSNAATAAAMRKELLAILERHLSKATLSAMAVMGLPNAAPEPWIFLAMAPIGPKGAFVPIPSPALDGAQFAEALSFQGDATHVIPKPEPNNRNPISCKSAALGPKALPVAQRQGLATAPLFELNDPPPAVSAAEAKTTRDTVEAISDPARSHFFNVDCVSCHTETRRMMTLLQVDTVRGVDPAVLPRDDWNLRNFGWFPSFLRRDKHSGKPLLEATATRRTAAETEDVVKFINEKNLLGQ